MVSVVELVACRNMEFLLWCAFVFYTYEVDIMWVILLQLLCIILFTLGLYMLIYPSCFVYLGLFTQTDGSVPNTLVIANCEVVKPRVAAAEHISQVIWWNCTIHIPGPHSPIYFPLLCCEDVILYIALSFYPLVAWSYSSMKKHVLPLWRSTKLLYILARYMWLLKKTTFLLKWLQTKSFESL